MQTLSCRHCKNPFTVSSEDLLFYEKVSPIFNGQKVLIPSPTHCPDCRRQRRIAYRNERKLYNGKCGLCAKNILTMYEPNSPFPVYCPDCWWSDKWDPWQYGQDFDFSRPFFEQMDELSVKVPHLSLAVLQNSMENSDYCNHAGYLKNCYLVFNLDEAENCLYGKGMNRCFNCLDSFKIYDCQSCYEASNCNNCAFCTYITDSHTSSDCHFSSNLIGCRYCFGCVNLRNKEYYFFNEPCTPEVYAQKVNQILAEKSREEIWELFQAFRLQFPLKWMQERNTENCTGDYLVQCKNVADSYDCEYLENSKYCTDLKKGSQVSFENQDISYFGMGVNSCYECSISGYNTNHTLFCENVWQGYEIFYSQLCMQNSHHLFGCYGLKHAEYAVFNKKYSPEEYNALALRIIEHMQRTGEWGEFFPVHFSPFAYNETTAHEYFPLTKEQVLDKGWRWMDEKDSGFSKNVQWVRPSQLPQNSESLSEDILNMVLQCEISGRPFKIQKLELAFYRSMRLPLPKYHPDIRHAKRLASRNPRHLNTGPCYHCGTLIQSTHEFSSSKKVYCNPCYLKELY